jgi:WD40 repeat protein
MPPDLKYDVFLSHSSKDKPIVRELANYLKDQGVRVWLDESEIQPGDLIGLKINEGLEQSRTLVLVMSANASESEWVAFETQTILFSDPTNSQRRFIPLRLDDAEIKGALKQFAYIDWRQRSPEQYARLLTACLTPTASVEEAEEKSEPQRSKVLEGHSSGIYRVAVTPNGRLAVSGSIDKSVRVWNLETGRSVGILQGHTGPIPALAISADGRRAVSGSWDQTVRSWDVKTGKCIATLKGHKDYVVGIAITPNGKRAVSCSKDRTIRVWDLEAGRCIAILEGHGNAVSGVALTANGKRVVSCSSDETIRVWDIDTGECIDILRAHTNAVRGVALTADGRRAVSCGADKTIRVWDIEARKSIATLEGHRGDVRRVSITQDGRWAVSGSVDTTVRVWDVETGECMAILKGHTGTVFGVGISEDGRRVVSGSADRNLRVWDLAQVDKPVDTTVRQKSEATRYTNAKVLLVGDSGVGKSGLAYRLAENRFEPTISTDAVWATQLKLPHDTSSGEIEREIWLWDFAGQADYRLIHQLFMDETALAVLVFNPQSENPFEGLGQWDRDLQRAARRPFKKILVAGRCDRGGLMVGRGSIERFQKDRGFSHYLETSAYLGDGCDVLRDAIIDNIPWDDIPWTASPRIFKLLKQEVIKLKDEGKVLLRAGELKQQLEMRLPGETFTVEQLRAVVGLLAGPGVVWQLEFGHFILLHPERINSYAAAMIKKVRAHTEEIGVILEEDVMTGRLDYHDMQRLPLDEEQIVLRAMHQTFVDHGLCLREPTEAGTLLVFPSYFKRERPEQEGHPAIFVTYQFNGQLDEIYSTLVVRLHHTPVFEKDQLWRFAADFKTQGGKRVGIKMTKQTEGAAEIAVYFEPSTPDDTKVTFIRYVHEHLKTKSQDVVRLRHYVCPHCGTSVENRKTALDRLNRGQGDIPCVDCEKRIPLWDLIEEKFASEEFQERVRQLEEQARTSIDNESKELILVGHAFAIAGEAGQIFRPTPNSDWGIDGEIEFRNNNGEASGRRIYLQLKSGDSYLHTRKGDRKEIFTIKNPRHARYWQSQAYPVMLVIRTSDGQIRWMNITDYLQRSTKDTKQVVFDGEVLTALSLVKLRNRILQSNAQ